MHLNLFKPLNFLLFQLKGAQLFKKKKVNIPKKYLKINLYRSCLYLKAIFLIFAIPLIILRHA